MVGNVAFGSLVAGALQPPATGGANQQATETSFAGITAMHVMNDSRLLGFNIGDWSMLLVGLVLAGTLTLFV